MGNIFKYFLAYLSFATYIYIGYETNFWNVYIIVLWDVFVLLGPCIGLYIAKKNSKKHKFLFRLTKTEKYQNCIIEYTDTE